MEFDEVKERFLKLVAEAGLPAPEEVWREGPSIVFCWPDDRLLVYVDPDSDDFAPIDELEAAKMKGLPVEEWPAPTADGYRDYEPGS